MGARGKRSLKTTISVSSEATRGAQQHLPIFRFAFPVKPQQRQFVALPDLSGRPLVVPDHQVFDSNPQRGRDAGQVAGDLTGAPGFPLCDRAAGDSDLIRQFVLCQTTFAPDGADAGSDVLGCAHDVSITHLP
jgi:hypothetical protein